MTPRRPVARFRRAQRPLGGGSKWILMESIRTRNASFALCKLFVEKQRQFDIISNELLPYSFVYGLQLGTTLINSATAQIYDGSARRTMRRNKKLAGEPLLGVN